MTDPRAPYLMTTKALERARRRWGHASCSNRTPTEPDEKQRLVQGWKRFLQVVENAERRFEHEPDPPQAG